MTPSERKSYTTIALLVAAVIAVFVLKKGVASIRKWLAEGNPQKDASQLAVRFYQAIDGAGTDEEAIFSLAKESKGIFNEVGRNYRNRYGRALDTDLAEDMSGPDLAKFYSILNN